MLVTVCLVTVCYDCVALSECVPWSVQC